MIYLDYNASTPLFPVVKEAIQKGLNDFGNPASIHAVGQISRRKIEEARDLIKRIASAPKADLIFTSGATESINMVLHNDYFKEIILTEMEHRASTESADSMERRGVRVTYIPVDSQGEVKMEAYKKALQKAAKPTLVSMIYVNNETGVIQPIEQLIQLAHEQDAFFHVDGVQAFGRFPFSFDKIGADYLSISSHKLGGPKGVGALLKQKKAPFAPFIVGGGQEHSMRGGTVNTLGIVGFGAAADAASRLYMRWAALSDLRESCEKKLIGIAPKCKIHGSGAEIRASNTMNIFMPKVPAMLQLMQFDMESIAIGLGSACSSGSAKPSHILIAMGVAKEIVSCSIRVSMGWDTSADDMEHFLEIWKKIYSKQ